MVWQPTSGSSSAALRRAAAKTSRTSRTAPTEQPNAEQLLEHREARELLDRLLEGLEHDVRVVFVLHELEELSAREIATALAIPLGTVASRLRRGRERFARRLARYRMQTGERR